MWCGICNSGVEMRDNERKTNIEFSSFDVWALLIVNEFSFEFVFFYYDKKESYKLYFNISNISISLTVFDCEKRSCV